ncbi:hypothetical protein SEA_PHINKY_68 [Microbacterium phage Phinky]|nr:hypothetical protein SEA_PHINKY_68 [Microbacterium phage Phinky]
MRVAMSIESDGVVTEVSREYEPELAEVRDGTNQLVSAYETPALVDVTRAVAFAAAHTHRITPSTT